MFDFVKKFFPDRTENAFRSVDPNGDLGGTAGDARGFGQQGAAGYAALGEEGAAVRDQLRRQASGQDSISAEQLRQGLQQQQGMQQAMAASARPGNAAMAARTGMQQAGRNSSAMAGQQAAAGLAERQQATSQLGGMIGQARQQDLGAALGGYGTATQGYGAIEDQRGQRFTGMTQTPTSVEGQMGFLEDMWGAAAMSDRRLKTDVADGGADADELISKLKPVRFKYKDARNGGAGDHLGIMAQDLESSKLGRQAVVETSRGKAVHGAKAATLALSSVARLGERLAALEEKGKK